MYSSSCSLSSDVMIYLTWHVLISILGLFPLVAFANTAEKKKNIVIILADDLGWNDVSFHNKYVITPNLDSLAADGMILNQSYTLPMCTPSRHALLSGRYPFRDGLQHRIIRESSPTCSPLDATFLPEVLKQTGYATHMVGKWHLGYCHEECTPQMRGFESFFGLYNGGADYYNRHYMGYPDLQDGFNPSDDLYPGVHTTNLYVEKIERVIQEHDQERPLFLYAALQAPHWPVQVPPGYEERYAFVEDPVRRKYLGLVYLMDEAIGRIVSSLKEAQLYNDTLILFMSDNGGAIGFGSSNYPLRGGKNTLWEGGTRVPTIYSGGAAKTKQVVYDGIVHSVDWFPTLLEAAGAVNVAAMDLDGVSQWRSLQDNTDSARRNFIYNLDTRLNDTVKPYNGYAAYRSGDYKLIVGYPGVPVHYTPSQEMCQVGEAQEAEDLSGCGVLQAVTGVGFNPKPIFLEWLADYNNYTSYDPAHTDMMLYNLIDDPHEKQNLASSQPEIRDQLFDELQNYIAREVHPLWPPPLEPGGPWQPISESESYTSGWCTSGHLRIIRQQSLGLYDLVASVGHSTYGLLATIVILSAILFLS